MPLAEQACRGAAAPLQQANPAAVKRIQTACHLGVRSSLGRYGWLSCNCPSRPVLAELLKEASADVQHVCASSVSCGYIVSSLPSYDPQHMLAQPLPFTASSAIRHSICRLHCGRLRCSLCSMSSFVHSTIWCTHSSWISIGSLVPFGRPGPPTTAHGIFSRHGATWQLSICRHHCGCHEVQPVLKEYVHTWHIWCMRFSWTQFGSLAPFGSPGPPTTLLKGASADMVQPVGPSAPSQQACGTIHIQVCSCVVAECTFVWWLNRNS